MKLLRPLLLVLPIHITLQRTNKLSVVLNTPLFLPFRSRSLLSNTCAPLQFHLTLFVRAPALSGGKLAQVPDFFGGGAQLGFPRPSVVGRPAEGRRGGGGRRRGRGRGRRRLWRLLSRLVAGAGRPAPSLRFPLKGAMGEWEGESPLRIGSVGMRYGGEKLEREERTEL